MNMKKTKEKTQGPDMEKIRGAIAAYFEGSQRFSIPGLCLALDICKETLCDWEQGYYRPDDKQPNAVLSDAIKKAKLRIEQYLLENDAKSATKDMAVLNSYYGYKQPAGGANTEDYDFDLGRIGDWSD
jgi:hypothetical protein